MRILLLLILLSLISTSSCKKSEKRSPRGKREIKILYVGGGQGHIEGNSCLNYGGLAPLTSFLNERTNGSSLIIVGSDNLIDRRDPSSKTITPIELKKAELFLNQMGKLKIETLSIGVGDLALGKEWVLKKVKRHNIQTIWGNLKSSPVKWAIVKKNGLNIVVVNFLKPHPNRLDILPIKEWYNSTYSEIKKLSPDMIIGTVSGDLPFARRVVNLDNGPDFILLSSSKGGHKLAIAEEKSWIFQSIQRFEGGGELAITFIKKGVPFENGNSGLEKSTKMKKLQKSLKRINDTLARLDPINDKIKIKQLRRRLFLLQNEIKNIKKSSQYQSSGEKNIFFNSHISFFKLKGDESVEQLIRSSVGQTPQCLQNK
jgi:hypothetical protein